MANGREMLVQLVQEKAGIGEAQAEIAVATVVGFMKERLPEPLAGQVNGLLDQDVGDLDVGGLLGNLGDMFGGDKK